MRSSLRASHYAPHAALSILWTAPANGGVASAWHPPQQFRTVSAGKAFSGHVAGVRAGAVVYYSHRFTPCPPPYLPPTGGLSSWLPTQKSSPALPPPTTARSHSHPPLPPRLTPLQQPAQLHHPWNWRTCQRPSRAARQLRPSSKSWASALRPWQWRRAAPSATTCSPAETPPPPAAHWSGRGACR